MAMDFKPKSGINMLLGSLGLNVDEIGNSISVASVEIPKIVKALDERMKHIEEMLERSANVQSQIHSEQRYQTMMIESLRLHLDPSSVPEETPLSKSLAPSKLVAFLDEENTGEITNGKH